MMNKRVLFIIALTAVPWVTPFLLKKIFSKNKENTLKTSLNPLIGHTSLNFPLIGHKGRIRSIVFSSDSNYALTGSDDHTARLWHIADPNNITSIPLIGHADWVSAVALSPNNKYALTGSFDNTARLWDLTDLNNITFVELKGHTAYVTSVAFSPNGKYALTGSYDYTARLWDLTNLNDISSIELNGNARTVLSVTFSPDGRFAVTVSTKKVLLWDLTTLFNNYKKTASFTPPNEIN